jgi:hypothetical protein
MKMAFVSPIEIENRRNDWFKQRARSGMTMDELIRLNDQALDLFPQTEEERRQKTESLMAMPEFVL